MTLRTRTRRLAPLAAVTATLTLLAACGGGGDGDNSADGIATLPPTTAPPATTPDTTPSAEQPATGPDETDGTDSATGGTDDAGTPTGSEVEAPLSSDPEQAALDYVECMRDNGIDMPDPEPGGGIMVTQSAEEGEAGEAGPDFEDEEWIAADEECQKYMEAAMGSMELDPEREAEMREQMLEYAQCMRDNGVDMPDPEFDSDGRVSMQIGDPDQPMDQEEFDAANEACADEGGPMMVGGAPGAGPSDEGGE